MSSCICLIAADVSFDGIARDTLHERIGRWPLVRCCGCNAHLYSLFSRLASLRCGVLWRRYANPLWFALRLTCIFAGKKFVQFALVGVVIQDIIEFAPRLHLWQKRLLCALAAQRLIDA